MVAKILDCTLRDGGYYTDWDFSRELVDDYIDSMSELPVDYVEIGYRSPAKEDYLGEYFYLPIETINRLRERLDSSKKLAIMINTKDISHESELEKLLLDCIGKIDLVRFAVAPNNLDNAIAYARKVKEYGFEVALNLMYLSQKNTDDIISEVSYIVNHISNIDFIYLVDSFGSCLPSEVSDKFKNVIQEHREIVFGFHGHDNIQLAFANTLEAMNSGVGIVDSPITGMGRGAGNLSTELICSYKTAVEDLKTEYTSLVDLVGNFNKMKLSYGWGASLPYIISGFNKLPQGEVMDLISLNRYSTSNIIKQINNKVNNSINTKVFNDFSCLDDSVINTNAYDFAVLVGGGSSVINHLEGLKILNKKFNVLFVHSTTKHIDSFMEDGFNNLVCLPGDEIKKIRSSEYEKLNFVISNDTEVNKQFNSSNFYSIGKSSIDNILKNNQIKEDAPLFMALKVTDVLKFNDFYLVGFDGYDIETQTNKILREENQSTINSFTKLMSKDLISLTPSKYEIKVKSLYSLLFHGVK